MKKILSIRKDNLQIKHKINDSLGFLKYSKRLFSKLQTSESKIADNIISKQNQDIKKNYDDLMKRFHIKPVDKANLRALNKANLQSNDLALKDLKKKYLNLSESQDNDKYNFIIKKIFKEEVLNYKTGKDFDDLVLFIKNCFKYNLKEYLTHPKYFRNKELRRKVTNTDLMEKIYQDDSPFQYVKELGKKIYAGNYYKIIKQEKNEKEDYLTTQEIKNDEYKYLNFLSETPEYTKIETQIENSKNNEVIFASLNNSENKYNSITNDLQINKDVSENFYIDFLMKMKEKEKEKSLGLSSMDDKIFAKRLAENKEEIIKKRNVNVNFEKNTLEDGQNTINREETHFNSFTHNVVEENLSTFLQSGIDTPWAYYGSKDYPYDEFFSDNYMKGTTYMVATLREPGLLPIHPPKLDHINDFLHIDAMRWNFFTMIPNMRVHLKKFQELMNNVKKNIDNQGMRKKLPHEFSHNHQSLIPYYNLLPKWAHEHPTVQNIVRGLEYYQTQSTFSQKISALNIALPLLLPLDDKLTHVAKELHSCHRTNPTIANIDSLFEHNEDETRKNVFLPDDEFTDDKEEFYTFYTAADIRAIEKEEEEERKQKKKEEGRAKRAAEEAKLAAAEGGDKKKDDKKDAKGDSKKTQEGGENAEEQKEAEAIEENQRDGISKDGHSFDFVDNQESEEVLAMKTKKTKIKKEMKTKQENKYIKDRKEALKQQEIKKEQDKLFAEFLKKHENIKLNENFIIISRDLIDVQTGKLNLEKINFQQISLSKIIINKFINEIGLTKEQTNEFLDILKKNPNVEIRITMGKDSKEEYLIFEKDTKQKEEEKKSTKGDSFEDDELGDLTDLYKRSLRETEIKIETEEDRGLKDIYYKPIHDIEAHEKTVFLPMDYYDNQDGFYDEYIKDQQSKIEISQYHKKPFITKRKRIKHISQL